MNARRPPGLVACTAVLLAALAAPGLASTAPSSGSPGSFGSFASPGSFGSALPGDYRVAASAPWWQAFQDPLLNTLLARSASADSGQQLSLVCSYIELRVAQARLALATRLQDSVAEQRRLLRDDAEPSAARQRWLEETAARQLHWAEMQQFMAGQRDRVLATLAQRSGQSPADLRALLQAAGSAAAVPQVQLALPVAADERPPTLVQAALQQPGFVLAGAGDDSVDDSAGSRTNEATPRLRMLQDSTARAAQAQQLLQASVLELQSQQLRLQAGTGSPFDALESYQHVVADADRLAALNGIVAVAWAEWLQASALPVPIKPVSQAR